MTAITGSSRMSVIPAIDIRGGKCVQLQQGDYDRETVYGVDPVAMAQHWHGQGATRLHIVDLDAAKEGRPVNDAIIRRIVTLLRGEVSVQVAGGVRDHNAIHRWIDAGVDRVVELPEGQAGVAVDDGRLVGRPGGRPARDVAERVRPRRADRVGAEGRSRRHGRVPLDPVGLGDPDRWSRVDGYCS